VGLSEGELENWPGGIEVGIRTGKNQFKLGIKFEKLSIETPY